MSYKECMLDEIAAYFIDRSVKGIISKIRKKPIDITLFSENCDILDNMWEEVCVQVHLSSNFIKSLIFQKKQHIL